MGIAFHHSGTSLNGLIFLSLHKILMANSELIQCVLWNISSLLF
jgi:hypothetical protein